MKSELNQDTSHLSGANRRITEIRRIFNNLAPHYDRMNRILSARQDMRWRKFLVSRLPAGALKILDVAAGTGDVALAIAKQKPDCEIVGVDFVTRMLDTARQKSLSHRSRIHYITGDALKLPFKDNYFDAATIAFGLRNIPNRLNALGEMARVIKPGGKVITLEMTFPRNIKLRRFFSWYLNRMIPLLGGIIARDQSAYRYLADSIQDFLHPDQLSELFRQAGLEKVKAFPLTLGITYLHEGMVR